MKHKCSICGIVKGKRNCKKQGNSLICPSCCASVRDQDCGECRYYTEAQEYRASKVSSDPAREFILEIDEEVEEAVYNALEKIEKGYIEEGEAVVRNLLAENPFNHVVQHGMGVMFSLKGDYAQSIEWYDRSIETFPFFIEAYFNKAVSYQKNYDLRNMVDTYEKVIEMGEPQNDLVIQARYALNEFEKAIREETGLSVEDYFHGMDHFETGFSCMEKNEWEQAIHYFRQCLAIAPNHYQSYGNMGISLSRLGRKSEAIAALKKALEINPDYEVASFNLETVKLQKEGEPLETADFISIDYGKEIVKKKKRPGIFRRWFQW